MKWRKHRIIVEGGVLSGTHRFHHHGDAERFWNQLLDDANVRWAERRRWGRNPLIPGKFWTFAGELYGRAHPVNQGRLIA
jgi:hypothetical protein